MKTIAAAVEAHIKSKPFLISALTQGFLSLIISNLKIMNTLDKGKEVKTWLAPI